MSSLDENGFQPISRALSIEACDRILAAIQTAKNLRQPHQKFPEILTAFAESPLEVFFKSPWRIIRSIFLDKTAEANWGVPWHQDLTICVRERADVLGFGPWSLKDGLHHVHVPAEILDQIITIRIHLDDCGPENGALRVAPGSHKNGRMTDQPLNPVALSLKKSSVRSRKVEPCS